MSTPEPIPSAYNTVTPHIVVSDAAAAIEFYKAAFGAEEVFRMPGPNGGVMHAEINVNGSRVMLAEAMPEMGSKSPTDLGGTPVTIHLYVADADAAMQRAVAAGATETMPVEEMFWGDRYGRLLDPFGHNWSVATHVKDLTPEEIHAGMLEAMGGG